MRDETVKYVVKELGKHQSENDITRTVVYLEDVSWEEAERIVAEIRVRCRGQIVRRQGPVLIGVGIATFIGGLALCVCMVTMALEGFYVSFFNCLEVSISIEAAVALFVIGLGMMIGGAYGIGPVVLDLLTVEDQVD
jgi:hypothetical protein